MSDVSDDQSPSMMAARGQTYGKRKEQEDAQRAVPMGRSPVEARQVARPQPAAPGSFTGPSTRPDEPITAGAPFGDGDGPAYGMSPPEMMNDSLIQMRAIYRMYPSQELADIIQFYEDAL